MGRKTKLTPEIQFALCAALMEGQYIDTACGLAGITATTFYRWMAQGDGPDAPKKFREFREAVVKARSQAEADMVKLIAKAAKRPETWTAAAWWLERSFPNRWGRQSRQLVEMSGPGGGPIEIVNPREQLLALLARQDMPEVPALAEGDEGEPGDTPEVGDVPDA